MATKARTATTWTLALVSAALFMVTLDNLVVTTALPSIRVDLGASIGDLEWTVNAYTLAYAVFLLTGAALGDRFGRRTLFVAGLGLFTASSAAAALAPSTEALIAARALQGLGAAIVTPLTLTLLSEAFPAGRRGVALGIWSGVSGLGVALGPVVGGAVVDGISWHWIFWINVPVGLIVIPLALAKLRESRGVARRLDPPGVVLASGGLLGVVYALVRDHPRSGHVLRQGRGAVHHGRDRDGAGVRAGRQYGPVLRAHAGCGPGLGRHQRGPRSGRCAGHRRARHGVLGRGLLRLPAGVHQRAPAGNPRGRGGACDRRD